MGTHKPGMLCATIAASNVERMASKARKALADGADLVEFRLDYLIDGSVGFVEEISSLSKSCIITLRPRWEGGRFTGSERGRRSLLLEASRARPRYIDLELAAAERDNQLVRELERNCDGLIISSHNLKGTPAREKLVGLRDRAMKIGDMAKVVTAARKMEDNGRILSLYDGRVNRHLIAFCMGEKGTPSRLISTLVGSPISYVSIGRNPVAPGQLPFSFVKEFLGKVVH